MKKVAVLITITIVFIILSSSITTSYSITQSCVINTGNIVIDSKAESIHGISISGDHNASTISDPSKDSIIKDVKMPTGSTIISVTEPGKGAFESNPNGHSESTFVSNGSTPFWIYMDASSNNNNVFNCSITITFDSGITKDYPTLTMTGNSKNNPPGKAFLVMGNSSPEWSATADQNNSFKNIKSISITVDATSQGRSLMYLYIVADTDNSATASSYDRPVEGYYSEPPDIIGVID